MALLVGFIEVIVELFYDILKIVKSREYLLDLLQFITFEMRHDVWMEQIGTNPLVSRLWTM